MDDVNKWVTGELGMKARFEYMYQQQRMHDVHFLVNGTRVGAHKLVLATCSPVFNEMFNTQATNQSSVIEIVDFDSADAFEEFIKFIYLQKANLSMENVFPLLYLSKHYVLPTLSVICSTFIKGRVTEENVSSTLKFALKLDLPDVEDECKQLLSQNIHAMISSGNFCSVSPETLNYILRLDSLSVNETRLVLGVLQWCHEEVARRTKEEPPKEEGKKAERVKIRNVIGDSLYLLRFPCMDEAVFACEIAYSGLLSLKEARDVFAYFSYQRLKQDNGNSLLLPKLEQLVSKIPFLTEPRNVLVNGNSTSSFQVAQPKIEVENF